MDLFRLGLGFVTEQEIQNTKNTNDNKKQRRNLDSGAFLPRVINDVRSSTLKNVVVSARTNGRTICVFRLTEWTCIAVCCAVLCYVEQSRADQSRVEWAFFLAVVDMWQSVKISTMKCRGVHSPAIICTTTRAMLI